MLIAVQYAVESWYLFHTAHSTWFKRVPDIDTEPKTKQRNREKIYKYYIYINTEIYINTIYILHSPTGHNSPFPSSDSEENKY